MRLSIQTEVGKSLLTARKALLFILGVAMLVESLAVPKHALPGHSAALWLAWVLWTRLFLPQPSTTVTILSLVFAITCVASNHGLAGRQTIFSSFYLYFAGGLLVLIWDKVHDRLYPSN